MITPISPTVVTDRIAATFMPSRVTMQTSPESRMYISSLWALTRQINSPLRTPRNSQDCNFRRAPTALKPWNNGILRMTFNRANALSANYLSLPLTGRFRHLTAND